ncbi:hypothetical protein [Streptomyces sp. NPDC053755]|uniref:hypothetical protein n=1 Tax=Streptomyces sp. NPDC053755 TaxID=3155815 RepID=UPI00342BD438
MRRDPARTMTGVGAAALFLGALTATGAAHAAPVANGVDARATLTADAKAAAPGRTVIFTVGADVVSGTAPALGVTIALPRGVTYEKSGSHPALCAPTTDGRTLTCRARGSEQHVGEQVYLRLGEDVPTGTTLTLTATADIGDAVDTRPEDNTATATVDVRTGNDVGVEWKAPSGSVRPGETVRTELVVTNHGPGRIESFVVHLSLYGDYHGYWPREYDKACWSDPGSLICDLYDGLAPGESRALPFTWKFPQKAAGTTFRVPAGLYIRDILDPVAENDRDELVIRIAKGSKPTPPATPPTATPTTGSPSPEPTATPAPTSSSPAPAPSVTPPGGSGSGGELARTGSGSVAATAGLAGTLIVAGGLALLVRPRKVSGRPDA